MRLYRDKPRKSVGTSYAARFDDEASIPDVLAVARKDDYRAEVAFVPDFDALLVKTTDERGNPDWDIVERGHLLVYSQTFAVLYTTDVNEFEREHEPVGGEPISSA